MLPTIQIGYQHTVLKILWPKKMHTLADQCRNPSGWWASRQTITAEYGGWARYCWTSRTSRVAQQHFISCETETPGNTKKLALSMTKKLPLNASYLAIFYYLLIVHKTSAPSDDILNTASFGIPNHHRHNTCDTRDRNFLHTPQLLHESWITKWKIIPKARN